MNKRKINSPHGRTHDAILQPKKSKPLTTQEEMINFFKGWQSADDIVTNYVNGLEKQAKDILKGKGFDPDEPFKQYKLINGDVGNYDAAIAELGISAEKYANEIVLRAKFLKKFIEEGNIYESLKEALLMEAARTELFVFDVEIPLKIGLEFMSTRGKGVKKYTDEQKKGWKEIYASLNIEGKSRQWIAKKIIAIDPFFKHKSQEQKDKAVSSVRDFIVKHIE